MPHAPLTSRAARWTFIAAALATFLAVCLGSVVCATDASASCPGWPGCYPGAVLPRGHVHPLVEFIHRVAAMSTAPLILASAILGTRRGTGPLLRMVPWLALLGALAAGVFGMMVILYTLPMPLAVADLLGSLLALLGICCSAASACRGTRERLPMTARTALAAVIGLMTLHGLGIATAGRGSFTRCMGWPMLQHLDADSTWLQVVRWLLSAGLAILLVALAVQTRWSRPKLAWLAVTPSVLLGVEIVLGLTMADGSTLTTKAVYATIAVLIFTAVCTLTGMLLTPRPDARRRRAERLAAHETSP